jgi:predicted ATP-grasp superfamily ATP-dependent carboligase
MDLIVLDGNQRSALAVVRSLGSKGIKIVVGEESNPSLSSVSRYCSSEFSYPSPYINPESFIETIQEISVQNRGAMLFCMTDVTLREILEHKTNFSDHIQIPFADYDKYVAISNKLRLFRFAKDLSVLIPNTLFSTDFKNARDLIAKVKKLGFPCVLKPASSRLRTAHGWMNAEVRYAKNPTELKAILDCEPFKSYPFLIQEKIEGPGVGIFLLMYQGRIIARFAHQRVREKPPSGGVSVLCQSIIPPPEAIDAASALLESLAWSGVAMVEFKLDVRDNMPKLMEINGRFWGSLQLAISAGVDFPYLLYSLAKGEKVIPPNSYRVGIKSRWELGDLDHFLIRLKRKSSEYPLPSPFTGTFLKEFIWDFFRPSIRNEVFRPNDPRPFFFEVKQYLREMIH